MSKPTHFKTITWHIFVTIVQSILIAALIFILSECIWSFFGPHYKAPVANEEWLWSLTQVTLIFLVIAEVSFWIFRISKLINLILK